MYLKHLELQGYKSFARKTEFVFERAITAIVGPNGSGKSNIADAVRWVLGETRITQLRAKVTDDLIFAGSNSKARLGMAQVAMTLDNSSGTLPTDYSEVTIERRAYRDGQNEYLINGTKVRLRDIVELLGAGGLTRDAYTVIGQGLVDTALALRPQERRALIDVAAGIRPLQDKRDRALAQLDETHGNLTRVRDIAAEIAPRLRRLEKQAERARQGAEIARELAEALRSYYGYQWHAGQHQLREARAADGLARQTLAQRRAALEAVEEQIDSRRDREESQADALSDLREQRAGVRSRYEAIRRDLAVRQERMTLLQRRRQELGREIAELEAQRAAQRRQLEETESGLARLGRQCDELATRLEAVRSQRAGAEQRRAEYQFALEGARQKAFDLAATLADLHNRLSVLAERRDDLLRELETQQQAVAGLSVQLDNRQAAVADARRQLEHHEQEQQQLTRDRELCLTQLQEATARLDAARRNAEDARRHLDRLQARRDALAEMRSAGTGEAAGARALLNARNEVGGVVGSLASLIQVPAEFETAIEAALGSDLHALVVETWDDARRAVVWLQTNQAGRATLVHAEGTAEAERPEQVTGPGIIGVASELVQCDPRRKPLIDRLLGRVIVVDQLETAQRLAGRSHTVVTLDGTVVRPAGQITGGTLQATVLRLERLWRELPAQIQTAQAGTDRLAEEQEGERAAVEEATGRLEELEAGLRQVQAGLAEARATTEQARRDTEALERELDWRQDVLARRDEELQTVQDQAADREGRLAQVQSQHAEAEARIEALKAELARLEADSVRDELAEAEKQWAVAQSDRQNQQLRQQDLLAALAGADRQIENKQGQMAALATDIQALEAQVESTAADERRLAGELDALEREMEPAERALQSMRREGRDLEREAARARDLLRQAETAVSEATLNVQRHEDRLLALRDRIADDLELAAVSEELPRQLALALEGEAEGLPAVTQIPEGLERRVQQLRRQMRELGSASPELIAEYEETQARYDFLTSQAGDLEEAAADLRAVAAELTDAMRTRFDATFAAVSQAFERYFTRLFGGGEARMFLVEDEAGDPGLEIVARPPGKRSQSLALFSGGERALTAVALLFALLQASPTPFCVLDEVDAMLDEANIGRFRTVLQELAEETQFVIITHNRGTIQAADTIYGISMGDEGVSQAISLRLDELEPVAA